MCCTGAVDLGLFEVVDRSRRPDEHRRYPTERLPIIMTLAKTTVVTVLVFAFSSFGCTPHYSTDANADNDVQETSDGEPGVLSEDDVLEIAKRELAVRDTWADRAEFDVSRDGESWSVYIVRLPKTPGGHRVVTIDSNGTVTDYFRGR